MHLLIIMKKLRSKSITGLGDLSVQVGALLQHSNFRDKKIAYVNFFRILLV